MRANGVATERIRSRDEPTLTTSARKLILGKRLERLEALSDGVVAIAITLLVLDIAVPDDSGGDLLGAVLDLWPSYLAYGISVVTIGVLWIAHSSITGLLAQADSVMLRLNLLFLALVSFIPFPTRLVSDYLTQTDAERTALTAYALVLLATNLSLALAWRWAAHERRLIRDDVTDDEIDAMNTRFTPSLVIYVIAVVAAVFLPLVAVILFFASAVWLAIPRHTLVARRTRGG